MDDPEGDQPNEDARFAASVKRLREREGWSQGELARRMVSSGRDGFHQTTVSRIEKNERPVRIGEAISLAEIFDTTVVDMTAPTNEARAVDKLSRELSYIRANEDALGEAVLRYMHSQTSLRYALKDVDSVIADNPEVPPTKRPLGFARGESEYYLSRSYLDVIDDAMRRENGDDPDEE